MTSERCTLDDIRLANSQLSAAGKDRSGGISMVSSITAIAERQSGEKNRVSVPFRRERLPDRERQSDSAVGPRSRGREVDRRKAAKRGRWENWMKRSGDDVGQQSIRTDHVHAGDWRARLGSNQQPLPSEGSTLSIELRAHAAKIRQKRCKITRLMRNAAPKRDRENTRFRAVRPPRVRRYKALHALGRFRNRLKRPIHHAT